MKQKSINNILYIAFLLIVLYVSIIIQFNYKENLTSGNYPNSVTKPLLDGVYKVKKIRVMTIVVPKIYIKITQHLILNIVEQIIYDIGEDLRMVNVPPQACVWVCMMLQNRIYLHRLYHQKEQNA